jgi:maleate isomerase
MLPDDDIALYVSRISYTSDCTPENLKAMAPDMTRAASLLAPNLALDTIAYGCTSGTVNIGYEGVVERIRTARPGIPVSTPISGAVSAFRHLGVNKIAVVTPYIDSVNQTISNYLLDEGIEITGMTGFSLTADNDIASIPADALMEAARDVITPETEAVFFSCTALVIARDIDGMEASLGMPVICSNQAMLWEALRKANYTKPIAGFGQLMSSTQT